ncbi:MAG: NYN domain-containing protein [bacterium]
MKGKNKIQLKNYAFIDSQNLNLSVKDMGWSLDFQRLRVYLEDKFSVKKAFLFLGFIPEQQRMYTNLQEWGYILIFKPTLMLPTGKVKGNVDAELVLHATLEIPNYDNAVIITGDGDFHCLIEHLKNIDKLEKVIIPNKCKYSSLLRKFNSNLVFMNGLKKKLELENKKSGIN